MGQVIYLTTINSYMRDNPIYDFELCNNLINSVYSLAIKTQHIGYQKLCKSCSKKLYDKEYLSNHRFIKLTQAYNELNALQITK